MMLSTSKETDKTMICEAVDICDSLAKDQCPHKIPHSHFYICDCPTCCGVWVDDNNGGRHQPKCIEIK